MKTLKDWTWCIDYTISIGQKDSDIAPLFFKSRDTARTHNKKHFPKGVVRNVVIKEK
jgi:hypothetical protein